MAARAPQRKQRTPPSRSRPGARSPVLLIGAGTGEATCGILYLAGYLRRHGVETFVRLDDPDDTSAALKRSLKQLLKHVRPRLVGISLKWFHHVARARLVAKIIKAIDPEIEIVLGGNSASYFWRDLITFADIDHVALGDGEVPLLALARGVAEAPNVVSRGADGLPKQSPFGYVQGAKSEDVFYSHFDEMFLSQLDAHSFSGWVAPGKGCGENCLYCGGTRGMQKATFGRALPFLRSESSVQKDHREVAPRTWQLRYDFAGSSAEFLNAAWGDVDLSRHATTYFLWGIPAPGLMDALAAKFERVFMVLDIGCFSESQRLETRARGLLKPCPTNAELRKIIAAAGRHRNLELEISGIAGLPFASLATLEEERALVEEVLGLGCAIGYQRLEAQPGALVTEHPGRFGMVSEATSFTEFLEHFSQSDPALIGDVPMVRFKDAKLEAAVEHTLQSLEALVQRELATRQAVTFTPRTRLQSTAAPAETFLLGEWLGRHRVPATVAAEPVIAVRSPSGTGVACAPTLNPRTFSDPALVQGDEARAFLAVLAAFERPTSPEKAIALLQASIGVGPHLAAELVDHLAAGRFLRRA